eukprot:6172337-Pleurochrysis_carterae.AAC.2
MCVNVHTSSAAHSSAHSSIASAKGQRQPSRGWSCACEQGAQVLTIIHSDMSRFDYLGTLAY